MNSCDQTLHLPQGLKWIGWNSEMQPLKSPGGWKDKAEWGEAAAQV